MTAAETTPAAAPVATRAAGRVAAATHQASAPLTVVVPVFNGRPHLDHCLDRLVRTLPDDVAVCLLDDASTDPAVRPLLARVESVLGARRCRVIEQPENRGFVATVNAGVAATAGDVILLNADTLPAAGWVEALRSCAATDARIATATPWSNHAEICSFPVLCTAAPIPGCIDAIAEAASRLPETPLDLPTGVGFCMWIRRAAWQSVGGFDAATFGRGYGEENDFCRRLAGHGWRNVLAPRAYVAHVGSASFGPLGLAPGGQALARLVARYPDYERLVAAFIASDPPAPLRAALLDRLRARGMAADVIAGLFPARQGTC